MDTTTFHDNGFAAYPGGICLISMDGQEQILFCNDTMASLCGYDSAEALLADIQESYTHLVYPDSYIPLKELYQNFGNNAEAGAVSLHVRGKQGQSLFFSGTLAVQKQQDRKVWALYLAKDMSAQDRISGQLDSEFMSVPDFYDATIQAAKDNAQLGIFDQFVPVFFNLTNFKMYNAVNGRAAGDSLIAHMGRILRREFPQAKACHLGGDHFEVLAPRKNLIARLGRVHEALTFYVKDSSVSLKAGLMISPGDSHGKTYRFNENQFDLAKVAADSIKNDATRFWAVYTKEMGRAMGNQAYILRNFEKALERGDFQVYYQPVMRTYTEKICGMEALSRWVTPDRGILMPGEYIPVLEEVGLVTKLDYYMVEQVAGHMADRISRGDSIVPVSVNLSRVDFENSDPFAEIEKRVKTYHIRREWLVLEVTESALMQQNGQLKEELKQFKDAGYSCWIDDFGSAYSSLNMLQGFYFDTLKMDMGFMRHFSENSRKIVKSIVLMAKMLGIHTLAEGVETKEQADFLREIGCEMIQGFYYAHPMDVTQCRNWYEQSTYTMETKEEFLLLQKLGLVNIQTEEPVALALYDSKRNPRHLTVLIENEAFQAQRATAGMKTAVEEENLQSMDKIRMAVKDSLTEGSGSTTFVKNGQYMKYRIAMLGHVKDIYAGKAELVNLSQDGQLHMASHMDTLFRNILSLYTNVAYYTNRLDQVEVISTDSPDLYQQDKVPFAEWLQAFEPVHPDDRERFLAQVNPDTVRREAAEKGQYKVSSFFRRKWEDGAYRWQILEALVMSESPDSDILYAVQDAPMEYTAEKVKFFESVANSYGLTLGIPDRKEPLASSLLDALCRSESLRFFLKDEHRRFRHVSRGFLHEYGLSDEAEIIGKTDEDMGWHMEDMPSASMEKDVLKHGMVYQDVEMECVIRGLPRRIRVSKYPLQYTDGSRGLFGFFDNVTDGITVASRNQVMIDPVTGLLSFQGIARAAVSYFDNFRTYGQAFTGVLLHIPECSEFYQRMGKTMSDKLLRAIAGQLQEHTPLSSLISHVQDGYFLLLFRGTEEHTEVKIKELEQAVYGITSVEDCPVTLYMEYALASGDRTENLNGLYRMLKARLDSQQERESAGENDIRDGVFISREVLDTLPEIVFISDADTRQLLYVNKAGLKELGLPATYDYQGRLCNELMGGQAHRCNECPYHLLSFHHVHTNLVHSRYLGCDMLAQGLLIPYHGMTAHLEILINLSRLMNYDKNRNLFIFREAAVNDMIEESMREEDINRGIQRLLAEVGRILEADRVLIFEENPDGTARCTYEWCRNGMAPAKNELAEVSSSEVKTLYYQYDDNQIALIDMDEHHPNKQMAGIPGVYRFLSGHLINAGKSIGFTGVVNPSISDMEQARPMLAILTRFIASMIRNRDMMNELKAQSVVDPLTGAGNRRAFTSYVRHLPAGKQVAFIFSDMNGLKRINDARGHEAGDEALCQAVRILEEKASPGQVFRMGGDEFLVVLDSINQEELEQQMNEYRRKLGAYGLSMAFGGAIRQTPITDLDSLLTDVDRAMYKDKKGCSIHRR
ncbi:EAL domain-containing protein [Allisonella histaminiformans]|uniref:EAL domain-containing protein n=1 Tax=Allisonella histaminiformans TaxID=209880 RepID=UPI003F8A038A